MNLEYSDVVILETSWFTRLRSGPSPLASLPACPLSLSPSLQSALPLSILGLPGLARNIYVIAQDNCIPEILFLNLMRQVTLDC